MFKPLCRFTYEERVVRERVLDDGEIIRMDVRAWLTAHLEPHGITWIVTEERYLKQCDKNPVIVTIAQRPCYFHNHSDWERDTEWTSRVIATNAPTVIKALLATSTEAAGDLIYDVFMGLYYPSEKEDHYNFWVQKCFPEIHEKMIRTWRMRNMAIVRDVMEG